MSDQKNLFLALALSLVILIGFDYLTPRPQPPAQEAEQTDLTPHPDAGLSSFGPSVEYVSRADALQNSPRVRIDTPSLSGSLSLKGGRIDDLTLKDYRIHADPTAPNIKLLHPKGSQSPYYAEFGWVSTSSDQSILLPNADTLWRSSADTLTDTTPIVLSWDNGHGLTFRRTIRVDQDFLFTITDSVQNNRNTEITLFPYGLIARGSTPRTEGFYILHEGPLGVLEGALKEVTYQDLKEEKLSEYNSVGGWLGITDKYWLTAIDLPQQTESKVRFLYSGQGQDRYQTDFLGAAQTIAPNQEVRFSTNFFAGAKKVSLLDRYTADQNIDRFDLAVDFGWFYFLTKPFFLALQFLNGFLGNFGLAILAFTVVLRIILYPLANKSYQAMNRMKVLQPKIKALQERFQDDRARMQQEMMTLYREEKINPLAGCLPILIQIPVFFALYKVLFVSLEMRHAPFYWFIQDLSAPDPSNVFTLFSLLPWSPPSFLHLGILPIIMGLTMWIQQKLNPAPTDPIQAKVMTFLPIIFTFMLASFPAGLVVYWTWNNILSIAQQWSIMRRHEPSSALGAR